MQSRINRKDLRSGASPSLSQTFNVGQGGRTPSAALGGNNVAFSNFDQGNASYRSGKSPGILKRSGTDMEGSREKLRDPMRTIKEDATAVDEDESHYYGSRIGFENEALHRSAKSGELDSSVRDPNRKPEMISGLTDFLQTEYRHKFGIFSDDPPTLFIFWKDHVSNKYKAKREQREQLRGTMNSFGNFDQDFSSPEEKKYGGPTVTKSLQVRKGSAHPSMQKAPRASSALRFEPNVPKLFKKKAGYSEYADRHEFDVQYSIEKTIHDKRDEARGEELGMHQSFMQSQMKSQMKMKKKIIEDILQAYYDYQLEQELEPHAIAHQKKLKKEAVQNKKFELSQGMSEKDKKRKESLKKQQEKEEEKKKHEQIKAKSRQSAEKQGKKFVDLSDDSDPDLMKDSETEDEAEASAKVIGVEVNPEQKKNQSKEEKEAQKKAQRNNIMLEGMAKRTPVKASALAPEEEQGPPTAAQRRGPTRLQMLAAQSEQRFYEAAKKRIDTELTEMNAILQMVAKVPLKPGLKHVETAYQNNKAMAGLNLKSDERTILQRLRKFFAPDQMVLRLALYKDRVNKSRRKGDVTLLVYYINCKPDERLNNFFAMKDQAEAKRAIDAYCQNLRQQMVTEDEKATKRIETVEQKKRCKLYKQVFGAAFDEKKGLKLENRPDLTAPKDKHVVRSTLKALKGDFGHEQILHRMLKNELADDQPFKYPEEYQLYDNATEKAFKKNFVGQTHSVKPPDWEAQANQLEYFKNNDDADRKGAARQRNLKIKAEQALETFLQEKAVEYQRWRTTRQKAAAEEKQTQRNVLADTYQEMIEKHGDIAKKRFPHHTHLVFGQDIKKSETMARSYPTSFKTYFYRLVNSCVQIGKGNFKFAKAPPSLVMMVGARESTGNDGVVPPSANTRLAKFAFGQIVKKLKGGDKKAWRSRVFKRDDQKKRLKGIFMQLAEVENCTFEPAISELPGGGAGNVDDQGDRGVPGAFVKRMGTDFSRSDPTIYKFGKIRRAKTFLRAGEVDKCITTLCDGFDLTQVYMKFKPKEWKVWKDYRNLMIEQEKTEAASADKKKKDEKRVVSSSDDLTSEQVQEVKAAYEKTVSSHKIRSFKFSDLDLAMRSLGIEPHPAEVKEVEDRLTLAGKREISESEFLAIMTKKLKENDSIKDLYKAFDMLDKDGSGALDRDEFVFVLENLGCNFRAWEIDEMVKEADADGNGVVSRDEFVEVMRSRSKKLEGVDYMTVMKEQLRKYLQREELKKKFARIGQHVPTLLDLFANKKAEVLRDCAGDKEREGEKKSVYAENLDDASYQALYGECWDLLQQLFKLKEREQGRKHDHQEQEKKLKRQLKLYKEQLEDGFDEPGPDAADDGEKEIDYRKVFKCIMCPLGNTCPKFKSLRWPASAIKTTTKVGKDCPYAHHPMELQFPQTLNMRIKGNKNSVKRDLNAPPPVFHVGGELYDCRGCSRCNLCKYKAESQKILNAMTEKVLNRKETNKDAIDQRKIDNDQKRDTFARKFGILKKASVLLHYGRANDAHSEIAKAAELRRKEHVKEQEDHLARQRKWQTKLGLPDGFELPKPVEKIKPEDLTDEFLKSIDTGGATDLATLRLYLQNVCPLVRSANDRDTFLNELIEDFYFHCEDILKGKQEDIEKCQKNIEKLGEIAELHEAYGSDIDKEENQAAMVDSEGKPLRVKKKKTAMCEHIQKKVFYKDIGVTMAGEKDKADQRYYINAKYERKVTHDPKTEREICTVCPIGKKCPRAHTAIELDLQPMQGKIKNLQVVVKSQQHKMKNDKPLEPWRPSAKSFDVSKLPDQARPVNKKKGNEEEEENKNKRQGILDRSNVFRKPFEKEE